MMFIAFNLHILSSFCVTSPRPPPLMGLRL